MPHLFNFCTKLQPTQCLSSATDGPCTHICGGITERMTTTTTTKAGDWRALLSLARKQEDRRWRVRRRTRALCTLLELSTVLVCQKSLFCYKLIKLGNVWVFVQLICGPPWPMNQLQKTVTLPNLRIPIRSGYDVKSVIKFPLH